MKKDKLAFHEFFLYLISIEANVHKINKKNYFFSIEIYNLRSIIKIKEDFNSNNIEKLEENYEKIIDNLLQQSVILYNNKL